jgi:hypothetical protein
MAVAGFCRICRQYVWLDDSWACLSGHPWTEISNWYDPQTGAPITPHWLKPPGQAAEGAGSASRPMAQAAEQPSPADPHAAPAAPHVTPHAAVPAVPHAAAPVAGAGPASRVELLAGILELLGGYPAYRAVYGTDTDIVIDNQVADAAWSTGKKKVTYEAMLKAVEPEQTVYFWEALKESGGGLSFGGVESESYTISGTKRSGKKKETVVGPGGVVADYAWDFSTTRLLIEDAVAARGWRMKTVLRKGSARW